MSLITKPTGNADDYVSDADYGLTADGEVVLQTDPRSVKVLVCKGCVLPGADAREYGLVGNDKPTEPEPEVETPEQPEPETKAVVEAPENKAHSGPAESKSGRKK